MIPKNEIPFRPNTLRREGLVVAVLLRHVILGQGLAVHNHHSTIDFDYVAGQPDHALDIGLGNIHREPEDHRVAALDVGDAEAVSEFIDKDALLIAQGRHHTGALHFDGLIDENDEDDSDQHRQGEIAHPGYRVEAACTARGRLWHPARIPLVMTL